MKISVELTLAPLKDNYVPTIKCFIKKLRKLKVIINETPLSTQIYGEYDEIMNMIIPMIRKTFEDEDAVMLHIKIIKGDRSQYEPNF
tara:strand:+ start:47773 stop:48033 length:261 start_codon:yes stop_codon:yes gene_type:complete